MLKAITADRVLQRQFAMYIAIGGTVFCVDIAVFQFCISRHVVLLAATTITYVVATSTHFLLNRYANFRRFDRAIHDQARTFVVIVVAQYVLTLILMPLFVGHGVPPLWARVTAIAVNLPFGFIANRYLTFGVGIIPRVMAFRKAK